MPVSNLADHAAAVAAGYARIQTQQGGRFRSEYQKPVSGEPGSAGGLFTASAESSVDQATADTQALASLNAQRRHRYGGSPGRASGDGNSNGSRGGSMTADQH